MMYILEQQSRIVWALGVIGVLLCLTVMLVAPRTTEAQFLAPSALSSLTLSVNPPYPAPGSSYTIRVAGEPVDTGRAGFTWSVNGVAEPDFAGMSEITLRAGELGSATAVRTTFTHNGASQNLSTTVVPGTVDITVEAGTLAPHFYQGRHLPSAGSTMRLVAVPHLYTTSGTRITPSELIYRWSLNDRVVTEGKGRDTLTTSMPVTGDTFVTLVVENSARTLAYRTTLQIFPATPFVRFYEDNPLYGLARTAIGNTLALTDDEVTVRAEPYFVSSDILNNAQYAWTLNRNAVESGESPQSLTLRKIGSGGVAEVAFSIRNLRSLLQYATGLFTIDFSDT